jgi:hypothetical protein
MGQEAGTLSGLSAFRLCAHCFPRCRDIRIGSKYTICESLKFVAGFVRVWALEYSLERFHVGNDADGNSFRSEPLKKR